MQIITINSLSYIKTTVFRQDKKMTKKKVLIITSDDFLRSALEKTGYFSDVTVAESVRSKVLEGTDILIVDDKTVAYNQYMKEFSGYFKQVKSNFYIVRDMGTYVSIYKNLSSYGVIVLPPQLTEMQIARRICEATVDGDLPVKSVAAFLGAGPGCGVSMVSQSVARRLTDITDKEVALLILSGSEEVDYFESGDGSYGLSVIKDRLVNGILSPEELRSSCLRGGNLYILPGEKDISKTRHYYPRHIEKLVSLSIETFDGTILNCGSDVTGMSIGGLNSSGPRYLVTTQSDKYFRNFKRLETQILSHLGINADDFYLIVNKYIDSDELKAEVDLARDYRMDLSGVIQLVEYVLAIVAERDKKIISDLDQYYESSIDQIANSIAGQLKIEIKNPGNSSGAFKNFIGKVFLKR